MTTLTAIKIRGPIKNGGTYPLRDMGMGITARIMDITPAKAEEWYKKRRKDQRKESQAEINMLVRHQKKKKFPFNGQPILFDTNDEVCDGQQRLKSCIESGVTITCLVIWGIPAEVYPTIDAGRARSARDALKSAGIRNQTAMASACQIIFRVENNLPVAQFGVHLKLSPMEILNIYNEHKGLDKLHMQSYYVGRVIHNMGVAVACKWFFNRRSFTDATGFYTKLAEGTLLSKGDPILLLRDTLMPYRLHVGQTMPMMIESWNAYRKKETLTKFTIMAGRPLPIIL